MEQFEQLVSLLDCDDEQTWLERLFSLGRAYGFEQTLFALLPNRQTDLGAAFLRSNYSRRWRNYYNAERLFHVDPTVAHSLQRTIPLIWTAEDFCSESQKQMYEEASSHGLCSGVAIPIHGPSGEVGMISLAVSDRSGKILLREMSRSLADLTLMRDFALESSLRFVSQPGVDRVELTPRELECLKWSMMGKTSWEIGKILNLSEAAINFHFANARRKFNVATRRQAVVKAISLGLLTPD